ncbi:hypothetical protein DFS34DRAFT_640049 [Phlyctochytrium arcticum]|nr:hypothetical protein DFS34DRAFT_640049 [Phlyctochytrium arcticum]
MSWATAAALLALLAVSGTEASKSECIEIKDTSACAPFGAGYSINATELGLVYGLTGPVPDAAYWDKLVVDITSGGKHQMQMWKNWAQCPGYQGELIQHYRTYTCITDLFLYSAGCNKDAKPLEQKSALCPQACDSYGAAVRELVLDKDVCPKNFGKHDKLVYQQVSARRSHALTGAKSCRALLSKWGGPSKDGKDDKSYAKNGQCKWNGVQVDHQSCGFSGNAKIAKTYCNDYPRDPCCKRISSSSSNPTDKSDAKHKAAAAMPVGPNAVPLSSTKAAGAAAVGEPGAIGPADASATSDSFGARNKVPIIAGAAGSLLVLGGVAVGIVRARRRRSSASPRGGSSRIQPASTPFIAPAMSQTTPTDAAKSNYKVIYDYTPQLIDELELAKGDIVEVWASYDDGWGKGSNVRTGNKGTFPMACIEAVRE